MLLRALHILLLFLACATARGDVVWEPAPRVSPGAKGFVVLDAGRRILCSSGTAERERVVLRIFESRDGGRSFTALGDAASAPAGCDLGDASLLALKDGRLWVSYRENYYRGSHADAPRYSIRVAESVDGGRTWTSHSIVAQSRPEKLGKASRGLWASCLLQLSDGVVQCYYDDEETPFREGFPGHQWLTMKTWDPATSQWSRPVTVSRAHNPAHLSRDGMASVVELGARRLLVAYESVATARPHPNVVRFVTSDDGGDTWSWTKEERAILYAPPKSPHMALAPWLAALGDDGLICAFCTDEDRAKPDVSGTPAHQLNGDVKYVISADNGITWSPSKPLATASHRYYLPGVATWKADGKTHVLAMYLDFAAGRCEVIRGIATAPSP